jgi:hypothetical protein
MFHYILEYCILLCNHSINTLIVPFVFCVFSTLHWLLAATAGTLMFLFVTLFLSYTVAFVIMVHNHGWPRSRCGFYNWLCSHYEHWYHSPLRYFLRNVWELFKVTHDLHQPLSLKCKPLDEGNEISLMFGSTIVKAHTNNSINLFTMAESLHVPHVIALQTTTILYTRHPQHFTDVLVKAMPAQPLDDDRVAAAATSASAAPTQLHSSSTEPTQLPIPETAPTQLPTAVTTPTANPQPATPPTKKRPAATGGKPGNAKRGKGGARSS